MIELKVAPYCENCPNFHAVTYMDEQRIYGDNPLKPAGSLYTYAMVTCEHADQCAAMYEQLSKIQKEEKKMRRDESLNSASCALNSASCSKVKENTVLDNIRETRDILTKTSVCLYRLKSFLKATPEEGSSIRTNDIPDFYNDIMDLKAVASENLAVVRVIMDIIGLEE